MNKNILKKVVIGIVIFLVVAIVSGALIFKFCFGGSQLIENVKNFDKETAEEVLGIMQEVARETSEEDGTSAVKEDAEESEGQDEKAQSNTSKNQKVKETNKPEKSNSQTKAKTEKKAEGATAEERIRSVASADEISDGLAILAKVDLGKVNALRSTGKASELKKYLSSVLSGAEIRRALELYSKYAYLL